MTNAIYVQIWWNNSSIYLNNYLNKFLTAEFSAVITLDVSQDTSEIILIFSVDDQETFLSRHF